MEKNEENNKLIAEFMGWTIEPGMENLENPYYNWAGGWNMTRPSEMKFNSSYDWLMPVWVKCRDIINQNIDRKALFCLYDSNQKAITYAIINYDIKIVFDRIVRFVQWYNANKTH